MKRLSAIIFAFIIFPLTLLAQGKESSDSLVRLISAKKIQLVEIDGYSCRKVEGPAVFLHNNTYLHCDTAIWNVDMEYIDAKGRVQIIQESTQLTGDKLHYIIPQDMAQFRGSLVELKDDKGNALRTEFLDYNTKDSIGYFYHGASMRDSTGNIIESVDGTYESKKDLFTFVDEVQMFSDSLFFVSDVIKYRTDLETAYFSENTMGWKNQNCFSSNGGWYDRAQERLYFDKTVYGQTKDYELWCEDFYFDRVTNHAILRGDVQVTDTLDGAFILGHHLEFFDEPRSVKVTQSPVFVGLVEEDNGQVDSVFVAADTLHYYARRMYEVDSLLKVQAKERKDLALVDPVENIRKKNEEQKSEENRGPQDGPMGKVGTKGKDKVEMKSVEETPVAVDSLQTTDMQLETDTLQVEQLPPPLDTTEVKFLEGYHHVMIFKKDNQIKCDSLLYSDLDSMARLFRDPVIWNEIDNQLTADSMQIVIKDGAMKKGLMLSNAFLASQASDKYYNQIKAPEMAGFFEDGQISRFDAMGGAQMLVFMNDSSQVAYANIKECKMISSILKGGNVEKNYYFESIKSDVFPIEDLPADKQSLKDFKWRGDERPVDRYDLTSVSIRKSRRQYTLESPYYPLFDYTAKYFPGYMENIMDEIRAREPWIWKSSKDNSNESFQHRQPPTLH